MTEVEDARDGVTLDAEMEFFVSQEETGCAWEQFKENVRPLKRGRKIKLLNSSLQSHAQNQRKSSLLQTRRKLIEAIDDYRGEDPLQPWLECIAWVQESFPSGGDSSGLIVIYEQCVRSFWHSDQYRDDLRYLKVWLDYAENCKDAEVIYKFLEANNIGKSHAILYIAYALHMESKSKMKAANEVFNLGISRAAQPLEKLKDAFQKFLSRSIRKSSSKEMEEVEDSRMPSRSFGTALGDAENRLKNSANLNGPNFKTNSERNKRAPIAILEDTKFKKIVSQQSVPAKADWSMIGSLSERNKENNAVPSKWTEHKIAATTGVRAGSFVPCIEVFVDEECTQNKQHALDQNQRKLRLRKGDGRDTKKEAERLKENPLRNFPLSSLPR